MGNSRSEDTAALLTRLRLNRRGGGFDLGKWIAEHLRLAPSSRLLDVGCGSGETLLDFSAAIDNTGLRCGIDGSPESVAAAAALARARGFSLTLHTREMDDLVDPCVHPELTGLTHITSVYALYYSHNPEALVEALAQRLQPSGLLAVIGPADGNNSEWFGFLDDCGILVPEHVRAVSQSFNQRLLSAVVDRFHEVETHGAVNRVVLETAQELCDYWRANIYHRAIHDDRFAEAAREWFSAHPEFPITKRIGLTRCLRPR